MRYFFTVLLVLFMPVAVWSQVSDTYTMPELVVTATEGFTEDERQSAAHTVVIDQETIANSYALTLSDILTEQGFQVEQGPNAYDWASVTIRGYGSGYHENPTNGQVIFLINGRNSGASNARQIALNNVERIEIIRGPEMYRYAASAPGGIINIITKKGGEKPFAGSIEGGFGSYGNYKGQFNVNGKVENFDYSAAYMYNTIKQDYKDGKGDKVKSSKTDDINALNFAVGYTLFDTQRIGVEYYYYDVEGAHKPQRWDETLQQVIGAQESPRNTLALAFTYDGETADKRFYWSFAYQAGHDKYKNIDDPHIKNIAWWGQELKNNQVYASFGYRGDLFDWSAGSDYLIFKSWNASGPKPANGYSNGYPKHLSHTTKNLGIWTLGTLKLLEGSLNITGGLRWDYANLKDNHIGDERWWLGGAWGQWGDMYGRPKRRTFDQLSPSIGVSYLPLDWLKLRASYVRGFKAPSGRQLFQGHWQDGYGASGFPWLDPEKSDNYEAGFDIAWRGVDFSATYFYSKFENNMGLRNLSPPGFMAVRNARERIQAGVEVGIGVNVASLMGYKDFEIRPFFNITYMTKRDELIGRQYGGTAAHWNDIPSVADKTYNYGIRLRHFEWGTALNFNVYYFGHAKDRSGNSYGGFSVANMTISQRLWDFEEYGNVEAKLYVNNIFDKAYKYTGVAADPYHQGRNFFFTLAYNF